LTLSYGQESKSHKASQNDSLVIESKNKEFHVDTSIDAECFYKDIWGFCRIYELKLKDKVIYIDSLGKIKGLVPNLLQIDLENDYWFDGVDAYIEDNNNLYLNSYIRNDQYELTRIYSFDKLTGKTNWILKELFMNTTRFAIEDNFIYISSMTASGKVDKNTGKIIWQYIFDGNNNFNSILKSEVKNDELYIVGWDVDKQLAITIRIDKLTGKIKD